MHDSYIHGVKVPLQFVALNDKCQKVKNNSMLVVCYTSIFQSTISLLLLYLISKYQVVSKKMKKTLMPSLRSISKTLKKQVHHLSCPFLSCYCGRAFAACPWSSSRNTVVANCLLMVQVMTKAPCQAASITTELHINCSVNGLKAQMVMFMCMQGILEFTSENDRLHTKGVGVFPDCQGEAAAGTVNAEEDHGHVLRRAHTFPQRSRVAVIHIALEQRQWVIVGAGKLFPFHHPAVEHLDGIYIKRQKL